MQPPKDPTLIANILESTLKGLQVESKFSVYPVWKAWNTIVGELVAKRSEPAGINGSILTVIVEHPAWIQELKLLTPKIISKIREEIPKLEIREIVFKVKK